MKYKPNMDQTYLPLPRAAYRYLQDQARHEWRGTAPVSGQASTWTGAGEKGPVAQRTEAQLKESYLVP